MSPSLESEEQSEAVSLRGGNWPDSGEQLRMTEKCQFPKASPTLPLAEQQVLLRSFFS